MTEQETRVLELLRTHLITAEERLYDHVATTFRWQMATLFAANGGAIVALFEAAGENRQIQTLPVMWFAIGVFLSILMGALSSLWGHRASVETTTIRFKIERALLAGTMDPKILPEVLAQRPNWKAWVPSYVGIVAFACLTAGMLTVARGL
jgi:hypothetical protein